MIQFLRRFCFRGRTTIETVNVHFHCRPETGEATSVQLGVGQALDSSNRLRKIAVRKVWLTMITIKADEKVQATIQAFDAKGNPAKLDGAPEWESADSAIAAVTPSDDGLSAMVVAGAVGTARVTVKVDADLGAGVRELVGFLDVEVVAGEAVVVNVVPGTPVPQ